MEATAEHLPQTQINGPDSPTDDPHISDDHDDDLLSELQSLRQSCAALQSRSVETEAELLRIERQNSDLKSLIGEASRENSSLRDRIEEEALRREELEKEVEARGERIEKLEAELSEAENDRNAFLLRTLDLVQSARACLAKTMESLGGEKAVETVESPGPRTGPDVADGEWRAVWDEVDVIGRLASQAESRINEFKAAKEKEKKELENSVVSLTEENRDVNSLLRVALVEKEAVEKSLSRLRGNGEQQKRVALLQFAERGLQRVGFGFMMGTGSAEQPPLEALGGAASAAVASSASSCKSDSSECEEEVVSLASTVERIMKNLRLEITQLRRSLDESRSDTERLQTLTEKQAQEIAEYTLYIKELEERERVLTQNVEELLAEIKETEADVARWKEACELEVEAGKTEIGERDKVVDILKQELEKTKAALDISNGKLNLKEELAAAAMAAQAAAERSLQLADSRCAGLRERIEELTRQVEEAESRERNRLKVRRICWPWRTLKLNPANSANGRVQNVRRMLPEMQALLHYSV